MASIVMLYCSVTRSNPWRGDSFYLSKPIAASTSSAELSTVERKAVKKLAWIPASKFDRYTASLHTGTYPLDELDQSFGQAYEQTSVWTLNLLDEALAAQVRPLLAGCTTLELHGAPLQMEPLGSHSVENGLQLLLAAREEPASRTRLWFRTPCAFKQAGRYAIYPQEFLLLQSLVLHWNTAQKPTGLLIAPPAARPPCTGLRLPSIRFMP